ncbi:MAG: 1,4-dihydroxy-2-naphthoate octaprenyltransferase [Planctomycetota bacterium]
MLRAWLLATRPKTLAASVVPVAVGTALASTLGPVRWDLAVGCLVGALLLQIACNFANDAGDALRGADTPERLGPQRAVSSGLISARAMLIATGVLLSLAFLLGLWLASQSGWQLMLLGIASVIASLAYTLGPMPLAYVGLGDVFVLVFFGFAAVLGSAWVQHPQTPPMLWWLIAAAVGLQATALIAINNLRDIPTDEQAGKRTLCVRLGDRASRIYHAALHVGAAICLAGAQQWIAAGVALVLGLGLAVLVFRSEGRTLNRCLALAAAVQLITAVIIIGKLIA